jgi:CRP-like cAMP-binding protein
LLLAQLGPGEIVGEMGVLDGAPRSATVIAIEDTEAVELGAPTVTETILQHPDVSLELLRMLSRRLRSTDELAAAHRGDARAER